MRRFVMCLAVCLTAAGCAGQYVWAPDEKVEAVRYVSPEPPSLTLFTMVNNETGAGGHSGLMINASERVIFDPAGTLTHPTFVERNDVLYGVTPSFLDFYTRAHARKTHHVVIQKIEVSPQIAEQAFALARERGPVAPALCANSTSGLLSQLPGFGTISTTFSPIKLMEQFRRLPNVDEQALFEYDDPDKKNALRAYVAGRTAQAN